MAANMGNSLGNHVAMNKRAYAGASAAFVGGQFAKIVLFNLGLLYSVPIPADIVQAITNLCIAGFVYLSVHVTTDKPNDKE